MADETPRPSGPILAPGGASPAESSRPETPLEDRFHIYESNPAPWWMALVWLAFLLGGAAYLVINLIE
jgi:hypothetical protein